jgi:uncharacterized membrane protein YhfC
MHVSVLSIIFMVISVILSIGVPVSMIVFAYRKGAKILPVILGAAAFVVFAMGLENIIHIVVFKNFNIREKPLIYIIYGVLMAGLFEETARLIVYNILKKKNYRGLLTAISYGIGHGGIEAVIIGGISLISSIVFSIMINTGGIEAITVVMEGEKLARMTAQLNILVFTAPHLFLVSGIERVFAVFIQMGLSIVMFYAVFAKGKMWLYPAAIGVHALIDVTAAAMQAGLYSSYLLAEILVFISAVLCLLFAMFIHKKYKDEIEDIKTETA